MEMLVIKGEGECSPPNQQKILSSCIKEIKISSGVNELYRV